MNLPRAKSPFRFCTRLSLTVATGVSARDLKELCEGLRSAPESVIYTHTHRFIREHQFLVPEPTNDFAVWVVEALQDELAGERLMAVDPVRFNTIAELRGALVGVLEDHIKRRSPAAAAPPGQAFHFLRSVRFSLPTPHEASDLAQFSEALGKIGAGSLYLHVFEARLRPPLGVNDFSAWLEGELGEGELARRIARLDPYSRTAEQLRAEILAMVNKRLEELARA